MNIRPNYNKNNEIISYRLAYSGKDPLTDSQKYYRTTWKVPKELVDKKSIKRELTKFSLEFEKKCENISLGMSTMQDDTLFVDFADRWLKSILSRNNESYSYYIRARDNLKVINSYFQKYMLRKITPSIIQNFYDYISNRKYIKNIVVVKNSISELFNNSSKERLAKDIGVSRLTLRLASTIGEKISLDSAQIICKFFNVNINKYFDIKAEEKLYSKATNASIRTTLVMVLGEAKRLRLIEHNFATKEYTRAPINSIINEKQVYDECEARTFVECLSNETDIRKKTIFSLLIFLGLRRSEVCGLCWEDIDFNNNLISIKRNSIYVADFGVKLKSTKTKSSNRTISMPQTLVNILKEYKDWWLLQQSQLGDLWANTSRLFIQINGQPINPCSVTQWVGEFEQKNNLKHIPPHSLRHTAITLQILSGVPLKVVSERSGHANENITLGIYTHALKNQDKIASDTYDKFLKINTN